jgi:hypothetical protein
MTTDPNETDLRRYLLGELADEDCSALEREYFARQDTFDRVRAVEHDLIDGYLASRLSAHERDRFERHYLASPRHRQKVALARELQAAASAERPTLFEGASRQSWTRAVSPIEPLYSATRGSSRVWLGWAAAITLVTVGISIAWQFRPEPERAAQSTNPTTISPPGPQVPPRAAEPPIVVATLVLTSDLVRSEGRPPTLTPSPETTHVDLLAPADAPPDAGARGRIETAEGKEVWSGPLESAEGRRLRVRVPAARLGPGDYLLFTVDRAGPSPAGAARYYFRIRSR